MPQFPTACPAPALSGAGAHRLAAAPANAQPLRPHRLRPLVCAWALAAAGAMAQELPSGGLADLPLDALLDMPVTGASRFVQRRSQASSSVTVIGRAEILALGHRTLADVLASVRGTMVATDRVYQYLGVRGAYFTGDYDTRVLVLIDGNRVNDPMYDSGFIGGEFPLDLADVERVEFVAGPGSAVYGANALFGVVNVITRESSRHRELGASLALGSDGERLQRVGLRLPLAGGGLQLAASHLRRRGGAVFDAVQAQATGDGWARGVDGEQRQALSMRWDHDAFTASLVHASRVKQMPLVLGLVFNDPTNRYRDDYTLLNLEHSWSLGERGTLTARGFAGYYRFIGDYTIDYPPPTLNRDLSVARWQGVEARITSTALADHRLVAGVELQNTPQLLQRNFDVAPQPADYLHDDRSAWRGALYGEDQWTLSPAWALHLGLRLDRSRQHPMQTSPRLAAIWQPASQWSLKALHSQAFRPPNAYESYYKVDAAAGYDVNPGLRSERVTGSELVAEWQPAPAWRLSGSLFRNQSRRLLKLGYDATTDRYRFDNTGALDTRGVELELEHAGDDGLRWRANYSRADAQAVPATGDPIAYPRHLLKATAVLPLPADWTLGLEGSAMSRRGAAPGQALAHLTLRGSLAGLPGLRKLDDGLAPVLTLGLRNLADRRLSDPGTDPQRQPVLPLPGRQWRLTLEWTLGR